MVSEHTRQTEEPRGNGVLVLRGSGSEKCRCGYSLAYMVKWRVVLLSMWFLCGP